MAEDKFINATVVRGESIGTTNRGIGPCYRDKVGRTHAIRMADLVQATRDDRIATVAEQKTTLLQSMGASKEDLDAIAPEKVVALAASWAEQLDGMIGDTTDYLLDACEADKRILFEGAQGALLDIDHGTFPFVTSSNSSGVGVCAGAGVPPRWIHQVLGVCKAYSTRVGGGPFPTELDDEIGQRIRKLGNEFGTTTGRPRRCGWFDAVAVRYTSRLSGVTRLALMMMDVLSHLDELKVCVAYELDGKRIETVPCQADEFPAGALAYVKRIEELVGIPVGILSVGPDRTQTIFTEAATELALQPIA
jgi:adenylosuccinate synthase